MAQPTSSYSRANPVRERGPGSKSPNLWRRSRLRRELVSGVPTANHQPPTMKIVVVDDEQLAREELCYQLGQLGTAEVVAQASNGLEAIAAVERHDPDLVLLDVQMPGLTGFEVARRLLQRDEESPALIF